MLSFVFYAPLFYHKGAYFFQKNEKGNLKMKKLFSTILSIAFMLSLVACSSNEESTTTTKETTEGLKIISLAPATTEVLTELGVTSELVAVDLYVGEGYENLPAFDAFSPDLEAILALEPDVVFVSGMTDFSGKDLYTPLVEAGIDVISVPTATTINEVYTGIETVALYIGKGTEGEALILETQNTISAISEKCTALVGDEKPSVYFEVSALYPAGADTYINEMIEIIGAENVFLDTIGWVAASEEEIIARNPDIILTSDGYTENRAEEILTNETYSDITAVINNDVYFINQNAAARPNHNIIIALEEMAVAVYGEAYN